MTSVAARMSEELIKTVIFNASERKHGLALCVTSICGSPSEGTVTVRSSKPGLVVLKDDGRIGFNINGTSYITGNSTSGERFLKWLHDANEKAVGGGDYGQPKDCFFHRCC